MIATPRKIDYFDRKILEVLQEQADISQRGLSERIGLSQNACWRRLRRLETGGMILGRTANLDRRKLGLDLVVFVMIKTRHHSGEWLQVFRKHVTAIPEVIDFFRVGGDYDYLLKVVTQDMASYDAVYQRLISVVELDVVTSYFAMEAIEESRPLHLG